MMHTATHRYWPLVTSILSAFATWLATANLDVLPPWVRALAPLLIAIITAITTMYGVPKVSPGVWSADSVEKIKNDSVVHPGGNPAGPDPQVPNP